MKSFTTAPAFRCPTADDIPALTQFLYDHGANAWNYLNPADVCDHLGGIADGRTLGVVLEADGQLLGFMTYVLGHRFARYQPEPRRQQAHAQVGEAVVHQDLQGQGWGTAMLRHCLELIGTQKRCGIPIRDVYVERHEENAASAGMMRKAGFRVIDTFFDPERRSSGSRHTAVSYREVTPETRSEPHPA